jgi:hypothetical protein
VYCLKCGAQLPEDALFCFRCGAKTSAAAAEQSPSAEVIAPANATQLKCPSCGAPISPKFGEMLITCEYCGSSVSLGNEGWKSIQKHTMLDLKLVQQDDVLHLIHDHMDRGLLHRHLQESSVLEEMNLAVVPYWLIPVSARTTVVASDMVAEAGTIATTAALAGILGASMSGGRRGSFGGGVIDGVLLGTVMGGGMGGGGKVKTYQLDNNYNYPVVALKALTEYQPRDYVFDLDGRVLFDQSKVKGMNVLNGDIGEETARYQAKTLVDQIQSQKAHAQYHMIQNIHTELEAGEGELLHVPVWFARYDHKGQKIVLVIDGHSGGIINSMGL